MNLEVDDNDKVMLDKVKKNLNLWCNAKLSLTRELWVGVTKILKQIRALLCNYGGRLQRRLMSIGHIIARRINFEVMVYEEAPVVLSSESFIK